MTALTETHFIIYQHFINERRFIVANKRSKTNYPIVMVLFGIWKGEGGGGGMPFTGSNFCFLFNITQKRS